MGDAYLKNREQIINVGSNDRPYHVILYHFKPFTPPSGGSFWLFFLGGGGAV